MNKDIITLGDIESKERKFHYSNYPVSIKNLYVDNIIISNKVPFTEKGFKWFNDYKDNAKVKQLCKILPKMSGYAKIFDKTK